MSCQSKWRQVRNMILIDFGELERLFTDDTTDEQFSFDETEATFIRPGVNRYLDRSGS